MHALLEHPYDINLSMASNAEAASGEFPFGHQRNSRLYTLHAAASDSFFAAGHHEIGMNANQ
jgi:hypothetical protein